MEYYSLIDKFRIGVHNMSQERMSEIRVLLFELDRKIKPLEWDNSRNQINEFKKKTLETLRSEQDNLQNELSSLLQK